jgi:acetoin utilization protein AcuB
MALPGIDPHDKKLFAKRQQILALLSKDIQALFDGRMTVRHLMSTDLTTVSPSTPAATARELMRDNNVRHLLVLQDRKLLGVISDRDLSKPGAKTARQLMTPEPITVTPASIINPAVTLMMRRRISCLPVLEGDALVGLFTTTDLMMALQCALMALQSPESLDGDDADDATGNDATGDDATGGDSAGDDATGGDAVDPITGRSNGDAAAAAAEQLVAASGR